MSADLDSRLAAYLDRADSENGRAERIEGKLDDLATSVRAHELDDVKRHGEVMGRLGVHSERLDSLEDSEEITGVHNFEQLRENARSHRDEAAWWKRWTLGIVAALVTSGLGALGARMLAR